MATAKGHRVPAKLNRHVVSIFERVIGAKRVVRSRRREEHEVLAKAEVLHVGKPLCLWNFEIASP